MLKVDLHIHTIRSREAFNTLYEIASEAKRKKMKMIGITDHGPALKGGTNKGYFMQHRRFPEKINDVRTLFGAELNILNDSGELDLPDDITKNLTVVTVGFHKIETMDTKDNTKSIINAMKNKYLKVLTHPYQKKIVIDIERVTYEAIKRNILPELNASYFTFPHKLDEGSIERMKKMIEICQENNHKMIIGSDAHILTEVGNDVALRKFQKKLGFKDKYIINNDIKEVNEFFNIK